jgi:hypothetical protein
MSSPAKNSTSLSVGFLSLLDDEEDTGISGSPVVQTENTTFVENTLQHNGRYTPLLAHKGFLKVKYKGKWKDCWAGCSMSGKLALKNFTNSQRAFKTFTLKKCSVAKGGAPEKLQFGLRRKGKEPIWFQAACESEYAIWIPTLAVSRIRVVKYL